MPTTDLADRVHVLRIWATARIEHCDHESRRDAPYATPYAREMNAERRTLEAVLELLADDVQASVAEGDR